MIFAASIRSAVSRPAQHRVTLTKLVALWRSRRALAELDAARLNDIGISAETARAEAQKPFWDVPKGWLR